MRRCVDHLAGLRRGKTHLAGKPVDAAGANHLGLAQAKLAILFTELIELLLFRFDPIRTFNGAEMLKAVKHDQRKQQRERR